MGNKINKNVVEVKRYVRQISKYNLHESDVSGAGNDKTKGKLTKLHPSSVSRESGERLGMVSQGDLVVCYIQIPF